MLGELKEIIFLPIVSLIGHPEKILLVGLIFLLLGRIRKDNWFSPSAAFIAAVAWAVFAAWEYFCLIAGYKIRVDLLVIFPVVFVISMFGIVDLFIKRDD